MSLVIFAMLPFGFLFHGFWLYDKLLQKRIEMADGSWERMGCPDGFFRPFNKSWLKRIGLARQVAFLGVVCGAYPFLFEDEESKVLCRRISLSQVLFVGALFLWLVVMGVGAGRWGV
jgi:hypothetical protein